MEKRRVTILIDGRPCSFYSDDSDEYIAALEQRTNAFMKQTAGFSGPSSYTNAVLTVLFLTDKLLRAEQETQKETEQKTEAKTEPKTELKTEKKAEPKEGRKNTAKAAGRENGQVSVWDLMEGQNT